MVHAGERREPFLRQPVGLPGRHADVAHSGPGTDVPKPVARQKVDHSDPGVDRPRRRLDQRLEAALGAGHAAGDQAGAAAAELGVPNLRPGAPGLDGFVRVGHPMDIKTRFDEQAHVPDSGDPVAHGVGVGDVFDRAHGAPLRPASCHDGW